MADEHLAVSTALENLRAIQSVIDGRISSLDGLRKLGSSDYTQHEIKTVEVRKNTRVFLSSCGLCVCMLCLSCSYCIVN